MLLLMGGVLVLFGLLVLLRRRLPFLGKLPGDIHSERGDFISCSVPLASSLILSILLTVVLNLVLRVLRK